MATLEINDRELVIHIHGWDKLLALRSTLTIPLASIKGAVARPPDAAYDQMQGLRVAGGYWPGSFAAGYFWVTGGALADVQGALEKLEALDADADPEGAYGAAAKRVDEAVALVRGALTAAGAPAQKRYLAFYDVHDPARTVGLDVEHGKLRRVIVELDDESPEAASARVLAALRSSGV